MRRRNFYFLLLLVAVLVTPVLYRKLSPAPQLSYQGKTWFEWLRKFDPMSRRPDPEAVAAVAHIGTNNLPYLVDCLNYERSGLRDRAIVAFNSVFEKLHLPTLEEEAPGEIRAQAAVCTFMCMGPKGAPALPGLLKLINTNHPTYSRQRAIAVLGLLGAPGHPAALSVLTNQNDPDRYCVLHGFAHSGTNALPVLPIMIAALGNTNDVFARAAAYALGELSLQEDLVVPALRKALDDPAVCCDAVIALGKFGPAARPAASDLARFLTNADSNLRQQATAALRKIAPEEFKDQ